MTTRKIETKYPGPATYKAPYGCSNCGWSGDRTFDRGKAAPDKVECPKCGCRTAKKAVALPYVPRRTPLPIPGPRLPDPIGPWDPYLPIPGPRRPRPWEPWPRRPNPWWDRRIYCGTEERCRPRRRRDDPWPEIKS